jgi:hypothetical protein
MSESRSPAAVAYRAVLPAAGLLVLELALPESAWVADPVEEEPRAEAGGRVGV